MATIGLNTIYAGIKLPNGHVALGDQGVDETGIFEIDTKKENGNLGSKSFNITNLTGTTTKIVGNNEIVDTAVGTSSPTVAIDSNMVNPEKLNKLLGRVALGDGGWVPGKTPVEVGLIGVAEDPIYHSRVFYCFGRGTLAKASQNIQTNTDTAQTREDDNLTYTAISYDGFDKEPYAVYWEKNKDFSLKKMFDRVFPDQTFISDAGKPGGQQ